MKELIKLLDPELIFLKKSANSDSEILTFLAEQLIEKRVVKSAFTEAVLKREQQYPTGLPTEGLGVAIPHTEAEFVNESKVAVAIMSEPVTFRMMGMPEQSVLISIVFLLALNEAGSHLKLLEELMSLIQNPSLLQELNQSSSKEEVIQRIFFETEGDRHETT